MDKVKDFSVPILLLLFGVLGKWLVRRGWSLELSFMGPELVLAGLGSDLAHFLDFGSVFLTRSAVPSQADLRRAGLGLLWTGLYIVGSMGIYLVVVKIHQYFESSPAQVPNPSRFAQFFWLALFCNFVGVVSMAVVVWLLRRF